jgi:hypothetical protein
MGVGIFHLPQIEASVEYTTNEWQRPADWLPMPTNITETDQIFVGLHAVIENVIVCFDDFERISDKLKLKDVLGLISELKEQKKCTVVLILNKKELKDEDLSKYKDKIVFLDKLR